MGLNTTDILALHNKLRQLFSDGEVERDGSTITCEEGSARFVIHDGGVEAEMPLHSFSTDGLTSIIVNEEDGTITVENGGTSYTFVHPEV